MILYSTKNQFKLEKKMKKPKMNKTKKLHAAYWKNILQQRIYNYFFFPNRKTQKTLLLCLYQMYSQSLLPNILGSFFFFVFGFYFIFSFGVFGAV